MSKLSFLIRLLYIRVHGIERIARKAPPGWWLGYGIGAVWIAVGLSGFF